ncbi:MAG: ASCH domain-containing protein [Oscillospiraceae bacterium]|nr:ASCH domain-containing protein [Oscillospiraceae bacterium]
MTAEEMWKAYTEKYPTDSEMDAWAFGDDPDTLAELVKTGIKTATCSAYPIYAIEGEDLPGAGELSVILDSNDEAVCIIRTEKVWVQQYCDTDAVFAAKEGEGDRSLSYWRRVHEAFFRSEMAEYGLEFSEEMKIVCEEFRVVWPEEERICCS